MSKNGLLFLVELLMGCSLMSLLVVAVINVAWRVI